MLTVVLEPVSDSVWLIKSAVMFKVFVTDKDGMMDFVSGKNPAIKPTYDECIESVQLWDLNEVKL